MKTRQFFRFRIFRRWPNLIVESKELKCFQFLVCLFFCVFFTSWWWNILIKKQTYLRKRLRYIYRLIRRCPLNQSEKCNFALILGAHCKMFYINYSCRRNYRILIGFEEVLAALFCVILTCGITHSLRFHPSVFALTIDFRCL